MLTWNASNVVTMSDDNLNVKPSKKRSSEKIDGFCALAMGLGRALAHEEVPEPGAESYPVE